ncbi:MAG: autotransporter outer membrane beta-barrel domain-containing protein [Alphaproteobacteria bacterium]|nr:autotransporter outer membrane beta-barrel domain-containing protein [Alphaproteobacteria bacterium]
MKKLVLLSSVLWAALAVSPALGQTDPVDDITTALTTPVATATAASDGTAADILLDTNGSITVTTAGAAVTINSNNSFESVAGTVISNQNTANAVGILVDLTSGVPLDSTNDGCTGTCTHTFEGITVASIINLTGTGTAKTGLWLEGPDPTSGLPLTQFIGNINMTGSTISITGDTSVGVKIDSLAELDGQLTLGQMTLKPSSTTSTFGDIGLDIAGTVDGDIAMTSGISVQGNKVAGVSTLIGMDITGTINGNLMINTGATLGISGAGAQGILITGSLNPCDMSAANTACTGTGALVNDGSINTLGQLASLTQNTGNPVAGIAVGIGGNIAGGIFNGGPTFSGDTAAQGSISVQGLAPAVEISPSLEGLTTPTAITIGVYTADLVDPNFSFYNRGNIGAVSSNSGDSTTAVFIGGGNPDATTTLSGGILNSGTITAVATSLAKSNPVSAIAINFGSYAIVGPDSFYTFQAGQGIDGFVYNPNDPYQKIDTDPLHDDQAAFVNSSEANGGRIIASIGGASGGEADAILISPTATVPSIINSGLISAVATTTDLTNTTELIARAIVDQSGTLNFIQNNGIIAAAAAKLTNGGQESIAIDLHADTEDSAAGAGVLILDQGTVDTAARINGDILFGTGDNQVVDVEGASTTNTAAINGNITYGGGSTAGSDKLIVGNFGTVTGIILSNQTVGIGVDVRSGGTLDLLNNATALFTASDGTNPAFHIESGGTLDLTMLQEFRTGIVDSSGTVQFDSGANLNITYGSFVPSNSEFVLITAPHDELLIPDAQLATYQSQIIEKLPFLFDPTDTLLHIITTPDNTTDELVLDVAVKTAAQLGLKGYAAQILPFANQALAVDDTLGAAFVNGITNQSAAQTAYNEMAPDVSGGARAIAVALTDQSSGPVAARQRILRMYGKQDGEVTLWGEEFAEFVNDPGDRSAGLTGFKDHGFGFVLGLDGGDPKMGWYGGAFSFYSGDIVEPLPRDSHTNTLWYMLTGYTDWRGKGLFLDTKVDVGYADFKSKRYISLTIPSASGTGSTVFTDEADSQRPGIVGAVGFTTGAILAYGSTTFTPQISVDGMSMREEGYTEHHVGGTTTGNGKGMDLQTQAYYANSLRAFLGTEVREDLNLSDFFVQPAIRVGYRYDFLNDPTKLRVNFADIGTNSTPTPGPTFTLVGPDPSQGNIVAGASLSATTDAWTLGANFDFVRGDNGATTEIGTIHLLGRI